MDRRSFLSIPLLASACAGRKTESKFDFGEPKNRYPMRGKVVLLNPAERTAKVAHERIEGWMEAMTMDFPVPDEREFAKLKPGATFRATVLTNDLFFWLTEIRPE
jgi:Cu/Ag efflux protein CusF